jgi:hypothetical protein
MIFPLIGELVKVGNLLQLNKLAGLEDVKKLNKEKSSAPFGE